ncbi:hypothetical protein CBOM_05944 [Ceraceosorus bombacis]|uniref:Uncharacterized protein n=1 Tax=Ceraceosorus bombacis TaxID=401625 RepID=A0A0P1BK10_9BASI|nr:hypothetical protein CBOM_05944 [Ceraceosorus bombacis]
MRLENHLWLEARAPQIGDNPANVGGGDSASGPLPGELYSSIDASPEATGVADGDAAIPGATGIAPPTPTQQPEAATFKLNSFIPLFVIIALLVCFAIGGRIWGRMAMAIFPAA